MAVIGQKSNAGTGSRGADTGLTGFGQERGKADIRHPTPLRPLELLPSPLETCHSRHPDFGLIGPFASCPDSATKPVELPFQIAPYMLCDRELLSRIKPQRQVVGVAHTAAFLHYGEQPVSLSPTVNQAALRSFTLGQRYGDDLKRRLFSLGW